ncbi:hypothetical protein HMPREF3039_01376 [Akkermansia sp. KLE1798]|nr:hypothetical protein HMPREF3039_01376 [Akkermansia sp. KLE1798]
MAKAWNPSSFRECRGSIFPFPPGMILVFGGMFTFSRQRYILKVDSENKNVTCMK